MILIIGIFTLMFYFKSNKLENKYIIKLNKLIDVKLSDMNKKIFIVPFIELGDNIIINGGIQYLSKKYDTIIYVCKKSNYKQISYMFQNLSNIIYYIIPDKYTIPYIKYYIPVDNKIYNKFKKYNISYINFYDNISKNRHKFLYNYINEDVVQRTYNNLKLDINIGYNYFKIPRDDKRENNLYNKLVNIIGDKYVIVIDDEKRNFLINDIYLTKIKLPIYKLSMNSHNKNKKLDNIKSEYIFDYIKILSNAESIYSIDTSLLWLLDFLNINIPIYAFCARNDTCIYRNKNIKKIDVFINDIIQTNINYNNYTFKHVIDYILSIF
jgi:hypothetical protein